jgi:hypothetical protein
MNYLTNPRDPVEAKKFFRDVIEKGRRHRFYERTLEVATFARDMMTGEGEGMEDRVREIRPHETEEQKDQRVRITNPLTPFALNQVVSVFRKTRRAEGIRFVWEHPGKDKKPKIEAAISDFFASSDLKTWAFDAFEYYTFWDPNAFFVVETMEDDGGIWAYPFEVKSEEAIFYEHKNGDLQYLIVRQETEVETDGAKQKRKDFYLYSVGFAFHYKEVVDGQDLAAEMEGGYSLEDLVPKEGGQQFVFKEYTYKTTTLPVFSFGVFRDGQTNRNTFVTPYEPARFLLEDLVKDKSLADLSLLLHNFPQKLVYGPRCEYESNEGDRCDMGYLGGDRSRKCPSCEGKGVLVHSTEQDVILLALPDTNEGFFPLSQLVHYATQNEWLPRFQAERLVLLVQQVFLAVFQTEVYNQAQIRTTATEKLLEWDKVYDTLEPYATAIATVVPRAAEVISQFLDAAEGFTAAMYVPRDFKMRGEAELLNLLAAASNSGAIPEVKEAISLDLLNRFYRNDPDEVELIRALRSFLPWKDKTFEQAYAIAINRAPTDPDRLLWENFDQISQAVRDVSKELFHKFPRDKQQKMILDEVEKYKNRIVPAELPPVFGPGGEPGTGGGEPGAGNL